MKIAFLLCGLSYYENFNNWRVGETVVDFKLSYDNYKYILYDYFENLGYTIDTFICTNNISNKNKEKELLELYKPVKYCFVDTIKGNNYTNSNYKIKINIEQLKKYCKDNNTTYDYILITRFDLYFNISFECISINYNMIL
jgi:hypothetical protein